MEKTVILQRLLVVAAFEETAAPVKTSKGASDQQETSQVWRYDGARAKTIERHVLVGVTGDPVVLSPGDKFQIGRTKAGTFGGAAPYKIKILGKYKSRWNQGVRFSDYKLIIAKSKKVRVAATKPVA